MAHKENRYCPFKRTISAGYTRDGKRIVNDKFCECAGAKCMAYKNGECLRVQDKTVRDRKKAR